MTKRMLIDAAHPEETRVVVMQDKQLLDVDFESSTKRQLKGNIYLAKITRVEPSLQAAFVEYGGNRHGFLAFSEIHHDYYQIPAADRKLLEENERQAAELDQEDAEDADEDIGDIDDQARRRSRLMRSYKIQEVIKRRQILLVQVVKEERGNKGAALTTYLSLAGRYCVLMPNTPRGGGISRKIAAAEDRRRLKEIANELDVPAGMGLIIRTAGAERTKPEIKRDYEYLIRLWDEIRDTTLKSIAPALIYEEGDLIKRALRDLYTRDIEEVVIEGEAGFHSAKRLMQMLMPTRAKLIARYEDEVPLFFRDHVEDQLDLIYQPTVQLPSGGSIVIHTTEALTAIDVNSGRSTRERHIDETAVKTNLEAADEVARQLRLRDLAGLIVIDFIDMAEGRHQRAVEKRLRDALKADRARIQLGRISMFGLMELSRQRLRPSILELSTKACPVCQGAGVVRSTESCALQALRLVQEIGIKGEAASLKIGVPTAVGLYLLNHKREALVRLEQRYQMRVIVAVDDHILPPNIEVEVTEKREPAVEGEVSAAARPASTPAVVHEVDFEDEEPEESETTDDATAETVAAEQPARAAEGEEQGGRKRRRRRRRRRRGDGASVEAGDASREMTGTADDSGDEEEEDDRVPAFVTTPLQVAVAASGAEDVAADAPPPRHAEVVEVDAGIEPVETLAEGEAVPAEEAPAEKPRRRRTTRSRTRKAVETAAVEAVAEPVIEAPEPVAEPVAAEPAPKRRRTRAKPKADTTAAPARDAAALEPVAPEPAPAAEPEPAPASAPAERPKRTRSGWWSRARA